MASCGQALHGQHILRQEHRTIRHRQHRTRQITPKQARQIRHIANRETRQHRHATIPGKPAITLRIARLSHTAIAVKVQPGGKPGIGPGGKAIRILCAEQIGKTRQCDPVQIIVEFRQHQHIRRTRAQHGNDGLHLRIIAFEDIAQQQTGSVPAQRGGIGGNAVSVSQRARRQAGKKDQAANTPSAAALA